MTVVDAWYTGANSAVANRTLMRATGAARRPARSAPDRPVRRTVDGDIDPFRKHCLMNGLDEIGLTAQMDKDIVAYEARLAQDKPWIGGAAGVGKAA